MSGRQQPRNTSMHDESQHSTEHEPPIWEPADGFERNAYTALFNVVDWIGFGLLLNGAIVLLRRPVTWREGFLWGLGAFVVFVIAPGLGLPPELPGIPAAHCCRGRCGGSRPSSRRPRGCV